MESLKTDVNGGIMIYINREQFNELLKDPMFVLWNKSGGKFANQQDMFMLKKGS